MKSSARSTANRRRAELGEADHPYVGFVKFADRAHFPNVDVSAEGSGIPTVVGAPLANLSIGEVLDPMTTAFFTRPEDINQDDITNDAVRVWRKMRCFRSSLTDNPGVNHFDLAGNAAVLNRLLEHLKRPRSHCAEPNLAPPAIHGVIDG